MSSQARYELLYHAGIPGRGEFVRLALAASQLEYTDVANEVDAKQVYATCGGDRTESSDGQPPVFAPPALRVVSGHGDGAKVLIIGQTANILAYVGAVTGLDGGEESKYHVGQVAMTALDLTNEVHDTHHPIAMSQTYEEQKEAAVIKAKFFREQRIAKYLSYFERVLRGNRERNGGDGLLYLVGGRLTYADTTLWQALDGLLFAFPKEIESKKAQFALLLREWYDGLKQEAWLKDYLGSKRRLQYSQAIWRHYPELDRQ